MALQHFTPTIQFESFSRCQRKRLEMLSFRSFFFLLSLIPQRKVVTVLPRNAFYP